MTSLYSTDTLMADHDLRAENELLKEALEEFKLQLSEALYENNQVSDATIKDGYLALCESIETWIGGVSFGEETDFNFNSRFRTILSVERAESRGRLDFLDAQRSQTNSSEMSFHDWMDLLSSQKSCNYVVLSTLIWDHLDSEVFAEDFPVGTLENVPTKDTAKEDSSVVSIPGHGVLLEDIINVMEGLYRNRDAFRRIQKWKSETLTAMVETEAFKTRQKEKLLIIRDELSKNLKQWISDSTLKNNENDLFNDIIKEAVKLHQAILCSSTRYELRLPIFERRIFLKPLAPWSIKSITTWASLIDSDGDWVPLCCQFPGLCRIDGPDKMLELVKPTVVVIPAKDVGRQFIPPASQESQTTESTPSRSHTELTDSMESSQSDTPDSPRNLKKQFKPKPTERRRKKHGSTFPSMKEPRSEYSIRHGNLRSRSIAKESHDRIATSKAQGQRLTSRSERRSNSLERARAGFEESEQVAREQDQSMTEEEGGVSMHRSVQANHEAPDQVARTSTHRYQGKKQNSGSLLERAIGLFTGGDSKGVDRFETSAYRNVKIADGPMRQPPA